jgi:riboflavin biosynthesis pyrimidine reductase
VTVDGASEGLSSAADKKVFGILRGLADAVMVGAGTLRNEDYGPVRLDDARRERRRAAGLAEVPTLVIVSGRLDLDPTHRAFTEAPVRPIILTHSGCPDDRRLALEGVADVVAAGVSTVDMVAGLAELRARKLTQVLCEGGPHVLGALEAADAVDEFCLTLAPLLVGPGPGRITAGATPAAPHSMRLAHAIESDGMLLLRYTRRAVN